MFDAVDAGKIVVVVDFVAISADVEMLFGEEPMMNSAVSMFAFLGGKREIFLGLPLFQYSFLYPANKRVLDCILILV